jgi:DNA-binding CsgD family transcriptional regulator
MRPADIIECIDIIRADPIAETRYGGHIGQLRSVFLRLLRQRAFLAVVFEDETGHCGRLVGTGISAFLTDAYIKRIKTAPLGWVAPDLVTRIAGGESSPVLSDRQLQEANATTGLTNFVWHACIRNEDRDRAEVQQCVFKAYIEQHRGYFLREVVTQGENPTMLEVLLTSGARLWNPDRCAYQIERESSAEVLLRTPHVLGFVRDQKLPVVGVGTIGAIFNYQRPQFGFRPSEQRLLAAALAGDTDEQLAEALLISLSGVKKTWRSIYDCVHSSQPDLLDVDVPEQGSHERGKQKKQRLLAYLRDHPEELRPISKRLLEQHRAGWRKV